MPITNLDDLAKSKEYYGMTVKNTVYESTLRVSGEKKGFQCSFVITTRVSFENIMCSYRTNGQDNKIKETPLLNSKCLHQFFS